MSALFHYNTAQQLSSHLLPKAVPFAHVLAHTILREGDCALDATAGNGFDTCFLADCVGTTGTVYAFDKSPQAIAVTTARIAERGVADRVRLFHAGHETMSMYIAPEHQHMIRCVLFNLGFLPHGGRATATQTQTTMMALDTAYSFLMPGGIMAIACYRGHEGGEEEYQNVVAWAQTRSQQECQAIRYEFLNQVNTPPVLIALEKDTRYMPQ